MQLMPQSLMKSKFKLPPETHYSHQKPPSQHLLVVGIERLFFECCDYVSQLQLVSRLHWEWSRWIIFLKFYFFLCFLLLWFSDERDLLCGAMFEFDGDWGRSSWIFIVARRLSSSSFQPTISSSVKTSYFIGETGVCRDTGSNGTVGGGGIEDFNKIQNIFSMLFRYMPSNLACI
jgi:hypothetical protein